MTDIIDAANDRAQQDLDRSIAVARRAAEQTAARPLPTECDNGCGEVPRERSRWCSSECREEAEQRDALLRRQGRLRG